MIFGAPNLYEAQFGLLLLYCLFPKFIHRPIAGMIPVMTDRLVKGIADGPLGIQGMDQFAPCRISNGILDELERSDLVGRLCLEAKFRLRFWDRFFVLLLRLLPRNLHGTLRVVRKHVLEVLLICETAFGIEGLD